MNILIPMAGEGKRFQDAGYTVSKPAILTYDARSGQKLPMVVCATLDLPDVEPNGGNLIYVERDFHQEKGTEALIRSRFPQARFIVTKILTEGQACTCLLAKQWINSSEDLLIAGCDNGMVFDHTRWEALKKETDVIVFTYRNNEAVLKNPNAYGWMRVEDGDRIVGTSIKKAISDHPEKDHAVVATFWFRHGAQFVEAAEKMIAENDRINGEFYVDQVVKHVLDLGYRAKVFEIERYIAWGTPEDYEAYQATFAYWKAFTEEEELF